MGRTSGGSPATEPRPARVFPRRVTTPTDPPVSGQTQPGAPVVAPTDRGTTGAPASQSGGPLPFGMRGRTKPLGRGLLEYATALVQAPAAIVEDTHRRAFTVSRLVALVIATMLLTGLVVAAFAGGAQLYLVPLKLSAGILACALLCLPSLYVFSSLAGASQNFRETAAALLMGVALIGVLLVGLAPVSWLFSQTTSSTAVMGGLHITALLVASWFGLGLVRRALAAFNGRELSGLRGWAVMFVLVMFQMSTTLRPLVGPYRGELVGEKLFFGAHWGDVLVGEAEDSVRAQRESRSR